MKLETPKIRQDRRSLTAKTLDSYSRAVVLLPEDFTAAAAAELPYGTVLEARLRRAGYRFTERKPFVTDLPNRLGTRLVLAGFGAAERLSAFERLTLARKIIAAVDGGGRGYPVHEPLAVGSFLRDPAEAEAACEAVLAAALAADFPLPSYKRRDPKQGERGRRWREIHLYGHAAAHGYARTLAEARGNNLARHLTALPPNELSPTRLRRFAETLARRHGWKSEFLGPARLRRLGAGAFLAVARGTEEPDAGILHLRYVPKKKTATDRGRRLALVGKGICFDTGGTNLKPARHMHGMHEDMAGSAVALGVLLALTALEADFTVDCWLALARNEIGPRAYRQNEVVRAVNGTTIEIVHTDAEGRLVLADTLTLATRAARPRLVIDYATLTGSCIGALSTRLSGALTNRASLVPALIEAGRRAGERVWPFPLEEDYGEALESEVADIKQCTLDSEADHILAGIFLKRFLEHDPDWVHLDLAASNHKGGLAHIPTDITGFGVRFTLQFLQDQGWLRGPAQRGGRSA